ncbi:MAG: hypothetical protein HKM07_03690, partial [Chlamydiae bacterium]|nr:hypothetical protein [Chlamydiota bacterium]
LDARQAESAVSKEHATLYFYKTTAQYKKKVKKFLDQMASNLMEAPIPNQDLIRCIQNVKWVEETESYLFQGNASTIATIKELITTFEIQEGLFQPGETTEESQLAGRQTFFLYELKHTTGEFIESSLKNLMKKMEDSNLTDASLMKTIENIKWIKENNSLLITGSAASIDKVKSLIAQFDVEGLQASGVSTPHQLLGKPTFLIYKAENIPGEKLMEMLRNIANDLKGTDAADRDLQNAISNMKYLAENNSVFFTGYEKTLEKIQSLAKQFDVPGKQGGISAFFLYELKNVRGDKMQEDLNKIAWRLKKSPENNTDLIRAIENIQWIKENNSLMLVGPASTLEQLKTLIAQFDTDTGVIGRVAKDKTSFFIYKPVNLTSEELEASLEIIYKDLKSSGLVDPELLQALGNIQKVQSTGSLLFTGSPEALEKIKELLANVDIRVGEGGAVSKIENVTFFIYQLQHVPATQLISSLKTVAIDLQNSNVSDKEVAASINSMKWIKETNSLLFTGSAETLKGVQALLAQFDNPNISVQKTFTEPSPQPLPVSTHGPSEFIIYKPQYVSGDVLIGILQDFKTNLMQTGVNDQGLFVTIDALRWIPKTRSLLVSGEKNSIIKVEELLRQFDVPSSANMEDTGEDNFTQATNFLVFKLQYQKGDEIQNAIKKIGTSLTSVGEASKQPLTEAINSLQWIEATNSLLASGDSESLQKIKHLIEDLDIPLNQVLIEVLVLETSLLNGQSFGLEWAARGQYKNRLTSSLSNVTSGTDAFSTGFNAVNPQVGPISSNLPLLSGFDLGVIGNTLFHKGQSFLTLASLINALQTDSDSTIIMNPKIVTQDNKSATVFVGQNIPFVGSVITSTTATQTSTTSLEYRNIGTTLTVTPVIGENDLISLEIVTEISSTVGTPQATETGQVNGIITNETTMNTRVHVPNQHFLILSGMLNDQETHSKTGIPCLGGLPIVGAAFSNNSRTATKNNVLIFVRPHIIKSYDDYKKVTEHQENLYKDQYPSKNMKESIDRGIDMLKTYIDE